MVRTAFSRLSATAILGTLLTAVPALAEEAAAGTDTATLGAEQALSGPLTASAALMPIDYDLAGRDTPPALTIALPPVAVFAADRAPGLARFDEPVDPTLAGPPAPADASADQSYGLRRFARQSASVPLEIGGLFAGITALGVTNWNWGSSKFRFASEGWFELDRSSIGMDKLGHAYSTYLMTEFLTSSINREAQDPRGSALTAGIVAMGLMTYVEVFDGFSADHGFSKEDMIADALGAGFSILRSQVPALKRTVDFRLEYIPSGNVSGFHPITDYSGQRYILAFQPAGIKGLEDSPLAFVELLGGYYARGFTADEAARGEPRRRELFAGIGINLQHLLFPRPKGRLERMGSSLLDYVQVPYTAVYTN